MPRSRWHREELQHYTDEPGNAAHGGAGNLAIIVRRVNPELARRHYGGPQTMLIDYGTNADDAL